MCKFDTRIHILRVFCDVSPSRLVFWVRLMGLPLVACRPNLQYEVRHKELLGGGCESEAMKAAALKVIKRSRGSIQMSPEHLRSR